MTAEGDLIGGRYRVERQDRAIGGLRRLIAGDTHLDRRVLVWVSDASGPDEDALLEVARAVGQSPLASFLRVLDVTYEDAGVAVVIESPDLSLARVRGAVPIDRRSAVALLEAMDRAETEDGLRLGRAAAQDVFIVDGAVLVDPIASFLPRGSGEPTADLDDVSALLVEHAEDRASLARALGISDAPAAPVESPPVPRAAPMPAATFVDEAPTVVFTPRTSTAVADRPAAVRPIVVPAAAAAPPAAIEVDEPTAEADSLVERIAPAPRRGPLPWRVFIPLYGALAIVVGAVLLFALRSPSTNPPATATAAPGQTGGPPAVAPGAGKVTVGLAATEDSGVRVTVDDVVQFDGTLKAGQRQSWEGKGRIDVWTDKGKTLLLAVNGKDLGPYSPAMGHADWNRIDFSFWPGFGQ